MNNAQISGYVKEVQDKALEVYSLVIEYFVGCTLFQKYAWGAIGLGLLFILIAVILW